MNQQQNQQPQNALEKQIQVVNLGSKPISYRDRSGQIRNLTIYNIVGNDGVTYETIDQDYFSQRKVGETLQIKYYIETKNSNGRIYSNYKLIVPRKPQGAEAVLLRLDEMEKNLLAAIKMHCKNPDVLGPSDFNQQNADLRSEDEINAEIQQVSDDERGIQNFPPDDIPF